jgi:glycosyltransferase involved in cell wall biosynthesis
MKIAFIHNRQAFLPELQAYRDFFHTHQIATTVCRYGEESKTDAGVYWYMMGFYPHSKHRNKIIIHEYASCSVPPLRKEKDFLKRKFHPRPDFRIFLNEYVQSQLGISDEVPFGYRDMGVSALFHPPSESPQKEYDFIYAGSLSAHRRLDTVLDIFAKGPLRDQSVLMLGHDTEGLREDYGKADNIHFHAAVPWTEVPDWLSKSRYALNFIPDTEPFNAQTPAKFLEYAAMKIPIVSTNTFWIAEFQERYGGNYFFLKEDLSNMTWDRILHFPFEFPNLESWTWEERIRASGIMEFLSTVQERNSGGIQI